MTKLIINPSKKQSKINKEIYGHFCLPDSCFFAFILLFSKIIYVILYFYYTQVLSDIQYLFCKIAKFFRKESGRYSQLKQGTYLIWLNKSKRFKYACTHLNLSIFDFTQTLFKLNFIFPAFCHLLQFLLKKLQVLQCPESQME